MTRPKFYDEEGAEKQVIGKDSDGNVEDIANINYINSKNITANVIKSQSLNINQNNLMIDSTGKLDSKANINTSETVNCKTMKATGSIHVNTDKFVVDQNGNARMQSLGIKDKTYQTNELYEMLLKPTSGSYTGQIRAIGFTNASNAGNVTKNNTIFLTFNGVIKGTVIYFPILQNFNHGQDIYLECCRITDPTELEEIQFQCISLSVFEVETLANVKY